MNYRNAAIDILLSAIDDRAILTDIAKHNPAALVSAHRRLERIKAAPLDAQLLAYGSNRVGAIKHYREHTNVSLRDAKDYVDKLFASA
jgi:ribosomal protein L7/L12